LANSYLEIQAAGGELLAVSPQLVDKNLELRARRTLPFPILSDDDQSVIRAWGLFNDQDPKQRLIPYPATYVVGMDGRVAWAHLGIETRDRPTAGEVMAAYRGLNG
jgi:peroxiredoxin Q/BCP